jgi:ABC-2 type transport system permease protein
VLAVIVSAVMVVGLLISWLLGRITERPLSEIFSAMALHGQHFQPFQAGLVHVRDIVYYLAVTYVALFAATRVLEARRWR